MKRVARAAALCALAVGAIFLAPTAAPAAGSSRAVVNVGGSNHVISFNGSVSGIGALQMAAGVETISYGGQGVAVCSINGVGNPPIPGECLGEVSGKYWSYWRAGPGAGGFSYAGGGAGGTSVSDGAVEGWSFGSGSPPPFSSFCAVAGCAPPPSPSPTIAPTAPTTTPATVAASSGSSSSGGSASATPKDGEKQGSASGSGSDSSGGSSASDGSGSGSGSGSDRASAREAQQAAGPVVSRADDGGSPWGVMVAAAAFAALGAGGFVARKRRRGAIAGD